MRSRHSRFGSIYLERLKRCTLQNEAREIHIVVDFALGIFSVLTVIVLGVLISDLIDQFQGRSYIGGNFRILLRLD